MLLLIDYNSLTLAYIGDAVYELYIRNYLVSKGIVKVNNLQHEAIKYVSAVAQRQKLEYLTNINSLTKEELDIECSKCIVINTDDVEKASIVLEKDLKTTNYKVVDKEEIRLYDYLKNVETVNRTLVKNDINVKQIKETGISLEDYFKSLIKEAK